jgi:hypothetical protein
MLKKMMNVCQKGFSKMACEMKIITLSFPDQVYFPLPQTTLNKSDHKWGKSMEKEGDIEILL